MIVSCQENLPRSASRGNHPTTRLFCLLLVCACVRATARNDFTYRRDNTLK